MKDTAPQGNDLSGQPLLRIGQFTDTFLPVVDGVGRVAAAYANTLCEMGHQVTVVTPMYDTGYRGGYPFELVDFQGVSVPAARQYKTGEATFDQHYLQRMRMIPLDIVHSHSPFMAGSEAIRLAFQRDIPLIGTFHSKYYDDFLKETKSVPLARVGVKFVVDFYNRCDEVWAVGERTADVLRGYGYRGEIQVMPNGVVIREAREDAVRTVRERFSIRDDSPLLLFVGQMNWKKNIQRILEASAVLRSRGVRHQLLLAGQGPDEKEIRRKIASLNLQDTARPIGHITDSALLDALYKVSDLFVFPSLYDNAPMVVREAAVMKTPSVMVRGSSGSEIIRSGFNGYLCEDTAESLAETIFSALSDPESLRENGENASRTIPVSWREIMETAVKRYRALIELNRAGKLPRKQLRLI